MIREIKFRAWDKRRKVYAKAIQTTNQSWKGYRDKTFVSKGVMRFSKWFLSRFIIEQYTGLKDKNGKEIYEGDIFRNTINGGTWRVSWDEKGAAFWVDSGVAGCNLVDSDWDRNNRKCGFIRKNCEVIGTIHENPELLEKGEAHE